MATVQIDVDHLHALIGQQLESIQGTAVDALAALCSALGLDPTLWPLTATTTGRVLTSMGRQSGVREAALRCGAIQSFTKNNFFKAIPDESICLAPHLPEDLEEALVAVGVESDAVASLYFDAANGPMFRQRIKSKWRTFCQLAKRNLIENPTGFFLAAIRKNWMLSSSYVPGMRKATPDPAADLWSAKEQAALSAQAALDAIAEASPERQWHERGATLRLLLRSVFTAGDLTRLEGACRAGILRAADLAREAAVQQARGGLSGWADGVRTQLR